MKEMKDTPLFLLMHFEEDAETKCSLLGQEIISSSSETVKDLNATETLECLIFD